MRLPPTVAAIHLAVLRQISEFCSLGVIDSFIPSAPRTEDKVSMVHFG
jgi:hypothetical protein